jgi:hypothetical protein
LINNRRTPHPGVIFNKAAVQSVGGYQVEDFPCEDLSLWLRLSKDNQICTAPYELMNYRINPSSISSTQRMKMKSKKLEILEKYPVTQNEVMKFISHFSEYITLFESSPSGLNRIASSLQEIKQYSKILGYELPKNSEITNQITLSQRLNLRIETGRNVYEMIIRNLYKKLSSPF